MAFVWLLRFTMALNGTGGRAFAHRSGHNVQVVHRPVLVHTREERQQWFSCLAAFNLKYRIHPVQAEEEPFWYRLNISIHIQHTTLCLARSTLALLLHTFLHDT